MMKEAVGKGVRYEVGEASSLVVDSGCVKAVKTEDGRLFTADKVLLATGAWTSKFLSETEDDLGMSEEDRIEHQVSTAGVCLAHFKLSPDEVEYYSKMPVLIYGGSGKLTLPTSACSCLRAT
jgi:sarcosine oxidase/L-pipecolate oxidase